MHQNKKIVVVGAGFGGIEFVKNLNRKQFDILLIDRNNYHNFQPLLYQVATGGLEPDSIAYPVRRIFRKYDHVSFKMAEVKHVDPDNGILGTSIGDIAFDYLVVATGSSTNFFNFEPVKDSLFTLKSLTDALDLRSFLFQNLEKAFAKKEKAKLEEMINVAIVGGGPAGIELAGALAEMKRYMLPKDFPGLDLSKMHINLYEAAPELLSAMSNEASVKALEYLKELGVNVFLNAKVSDYDGKTVQLGDGTTFLTDTLVWAAGVKGAPISGLSEDFITKGNRIKVNEFNQILGTKNCFAIGDVAAYENEENPRGLPMLAPVAQQQGSLLAKNLYHLVLGKEMTPFSYKNNGVMATIGRNRAVVDLPHYKFQGVFAWFVWMFVHIFSLAGFRNKFVAFIDWFSNYLNYDRPLGLIIRKYHKKNPKRTKA